MIDREKVLIGLECCADPDTECGDCPYFNHTYFYPDCKESMMRSALELLKADMTYLKEQEPRVLTLEELRSLDGTDHFVWLEDNGEYALYDCYAEVTAYRNNVELNIFGSEVEFEPDNEEYGKTWRCWSARPTEEQRKAVKWG